MRLFLAVLSSVCIALAYAQRLPLWVPALVAIFFAMTTLWVWGVDTFLSWRPGWDEMHLVSTKDGWSLPIYRYRKAEAAGAVLLVHGIYSSMDVFDLGPEESLARHLRTRGYDVYCLELRDMGRHGRRSRAWQVAMHGASFDDYVREDLPAAVEHVCECSGFAQIDFIGHSLGGVIYYPYGGTAHGRAHLHRAVTIGSLGGLPKLGWLRHLPIPWGLLVRLPSYGAAEASRYLLAPLVGLFWLIESRFLNPRHASAAVRRRYFANGIANSPFTLLRQFGMMYTSASLKSHDGVDDYAQLIDANTVPTLVIAGSKDKIVPLALVRAGFDRLKGEKVWCVIGKQSGAGEDFGHADLVFGEGARKAVWPVIDGFLAREIHP